MGMEDLPPLDKDGFWHQWYATESKDAAIAEFMAQHGHRGVEIVTVQAIPWESTDVPRELWMAQMADGFVPWLISFRPKYKGPGV
jgi:hypothetical protein